MKINIVPFAVVAVGFVNGYLLGSALREADNHFARRALSSSNINKVDLGDYVDIRYESYYTKNLLAAGLAGLLQPILPKECASSTDLFEYLFTGGSGKTAAKVFCATMPFIVVLEGMIAGYYYSMPSWKTTAMFTASTYIASGYFRGNTDLGFFVNPVGVSMKAIYSCFARKSEAHTPEERREATLAAIKRRNQPSSGLDSDLEDWLVTERS